MDASDILTALLATTVAHPYGHVSEGNKNDTPMTIHWMDGGERWSSRRELTPQETTTIHGGGFQIQDSLANAAQSPDLHFANALYKVLYPAVSKYVARQSGMTMNGDISDMGMSSGNRHMNKIMAASILSDLFKASNPQANGSLDFAVIDGAPGMKFNYRW